MQGTWIGFFSAAGSAARLTGPIYSGYVYDYYGNYLVMFVPWLGFVLDLALVIWKYKDFVPYARKFKEIRQRQEIELEESYNTRL